MIGRHPYSQLWGMRKQESTISLIVSIYSQLTIMGQFWIDEVCQNDWFEVSGIKNITQELKQSHSNRSC